MGIAEVHLLQKMAENKSIRNNKKLIQNKRKKNARVDISIRKIEDGYFKLLEEVKNRAEDDLYYYENKISPPGDCGYNPICKGKYHYKIRVNPVEEFKESFLFQIIENYFENLHKQERESQFI